MASRLRQSHASATPRPGRQSTAGPTPSRRGQQAQTQSSLQVPPLPGYQPPAHALNQAGRDAIKALMESRRFTQFDQRMMDAIHCVSENAVALNDTVNEKSIVAEKDRKRHDRDAADDEDDEKRVRKLEQDLANMQEKVGKMTQNIDRDLRKMIDSREHYNSIRLVLDEVSNEAASFARANPIGAQPLTQQTQTRSQRSRARGANDDNDILNSSSEDEEYHDFTPTDPTNAQTQPTRQPPAVCVLFKDKLTKRRDRYHTQPLRVKYAQDNEYRNFRRVLHDARWGDDAPPLPHESKWFTEAGEANLSRTGEMTNAGAAQEEEGDSDDDLQIGKETISTKCPLTLREFVDPVTSDKCPHSYERQAIWDMIDDTANTKRVGGSNRRGANDGTRCVECPQSGCSVVLTKADLHTNHLLLRKIQRIQRARREAEEEEDDEDGRGTLQAGGRDRPQEIDSGGSSDDEMDVDDIERQEREQTARNVKLERFSGRVRG